MLYSSEQFIHFVPFLHLQKIILHGFTDLSQINVTVNQSVTVIAVAEDPNNDTLSFSIIGVLPSDVVLLNNSNSITITWNGTMEQVEKKN